LEAKIPAYSRFEWVYPIAHARTIILRYDCKYRLFENSAFFARGGCWFDGDPQNPHIPGGNLLQRFQNQTFQS
jgi:hypothetical protein